MTSSSSGQTIQVSLIDGEGVTVGMSVSSAPLGSSLGKSVSSPGAGVLSAGEGASVVVGAFDMSGSVGDILGNTVLVGLAVSPEGGAVIVGTPVAASGDIDGVSVGSPCTVGAEVNPNGSSFDAAAMCSEDGRHLAIMPHLERSLFAWNWAYKDGLEGAEVSPWMEPFMNAFNWIKSKA